MEVLQHLEIQYQEVVPIIPHYSIIPQTYLLFQNYVVIEHNLNWHTTSYTCPCKGIVMREGMAEFVCILLCLYMRML